MPPVPVTPPLPVVPPLALTPPVPPLLVVPPDPGAPPDDEPPEPLLDPALPPLPPAPPEPPDDEPPEPPEPPDEPSAPPEPPEPPEPEAPPLVWPPLPETPPTPPLPPLDPPSRPPVPFRSWLGLVPTHTFAAEQTWSVPQALESAQSDRHCPLLHVVPFGHPLPVHAAWLGDTHAAPWSVFRHRHAAGQSPSLRHVWLHAPKRQISPLAQSALALQGSAPASLDTLPLIVQSESSAGHAVSATGSTRAIASDVRIVRTSPRPLPTRASSDCDRTASRHYAKDPVVRVTTCAVRSATRDTERRRTAVRVTPPGLGLAPGTA